MKSIDNTVVAVVQARLTSSRLPGKVFLPLAGSRVVDHVLRRVSECEAIDHVVLAVPKSQRHEFAGIPRRWGASLATGPEDNVLRRFANATSEFAETAMVVRVTADCPCIDPTWVTVAIDHARDLIASNMLAKQDPNDYFVDLSALGGFPKGFDAEVFSVARLREADRLASEPYDREHVTPYICDAVETSGVIYHTDPHAGPAWDFARFNFSLDTPLDYAWLRRLVDEVGPLDDRVTVESCIAWSLDKESKAC